METYDNLKGKTALILGGSSGLGLATAKKLASHKMNLILVHRDRKLGLDRFQEEVKLMEKNGVEIKVYNKDALKPKVAREIISEIPKKSIHLLLHSIAKGNLKPLVSKNQKTLTSEDLILTIHAMALSWYDWSQQLVDNNLFAASARNIAFTSEGNIKAMINYAAVSAAKATLESLMRNMALEYAPLNITTNCILAGMTDTPSFRAIPGSEKMVKANILRNPFHRLTKPDDVANVVYLMCQHEASWINGAVIKVDGGESITQ